MSGLLWPTQSRALRSVEHNGGFHFNRRDGDGEFRPPIFTQSAWFRTHPNPEPGSALRFRCLRASHQWNSFGQPYCTKPHLKMLLPA